MCGADNSAGCVYRCDDAAGVQHSIHIHLGDTVHRAAHCSGAECEYWDGKGDGGKGVWGGEGKFRLRKGDDREGREVRWYGKERGREGKLSWRIWGGREVRGYGEGKKGRERVWYGQERGWEEEKGN